MRRVRFNDEQIYQIAHNSVKGVSNSKLGIIFGTSENHIKAILKTNKCLLIKKHLENMYIMH